MKSIEEPAIALVHRRADAAKLRHEQKALFDACEEPYDWADGSGPAVSCGIWQRAIVGGHCPSCTSALAMGPKRMAAGVARRRAMAALTRAVKRLETPNADT